MGADMMEGFLRQLAIVGLYPAKRVTLGKSAVAVPLTGSTSETVLASVAIPALGPNAALRITSMWTYAGASATARSPRIRSGGLAGIQILTTSSSVNGQLYDPDRLIINRSSTSSQVMKNNASAAIGNQAFGLNFPTINLGVATTLDFTGQLVTGTDTLTLEAYIVELLR